MWHPLTYNRRYVPQMKGGVDIVVVVAHNRILQRSSIKKIQVKVRKY